MARTARRFELPPLGTLGQEMALAVPETPGRYLLKATAVAESGSRTVSRRKVTIDRGLAAGENPPG